MSPQPISDPHVILKKYWGYDAFRPLQLDIIQSVVSGRDTVGMLPTGGGKSICFQVPGLMLGGLTLVISPLIALMQDQVDNLNRRHIPAAMISSIQSQQAQNEILGLCKSGMVKFLYCSPEKIQSEAFYRILKQLPVTMLAVDESHCISQWGNDFRPAYLEISALREVIPHVPCIALTASATPPVVKDICEKLNLKNPLIQKGSFRRSNLRYFVLYEDNPEAKMLEVIRKTGGSGIVYARSRKGTTQLAEMLKRAGISAEAYHAGLPTEKRNEIQAAWIENRIQAIAATNAFGMGIDKPDVRWVIHLSPPPDMESYYQEAGRAGRDGKNAFAVLITRPNLHNQLAERQQAFFPSWEAFQKVCQFLWNKSIQEESYHYTWDVQACAEQIGIRVGVLMRCVQILEREGMLTLQEPDASKGRLRFVTSPEYIRDAMDTRRDGALIEKILRELGGQAFREYMDFDMLKWSKDIKSTPEALAKQLQVLDAGQYISFMWGGTLPIIRLHAHVMPSEPESVRWKRHQQLQGLSLERLQYMVHYAEHTKTCRTRMICEYFGEENVPNCGVCDVCSGRHSDAITQDAMKRFRSEVKSLLSKGVSNIRQLEGEVRTLHPGVRTIAIRKLIEEGSVVVEGEHIRMKT